MPKRLSASTVAYNGSAITGTEGFAREKNADFIVSEGEDGDARHLPRNPDASRMTAYRSAAMSFGSIEPRLAIVAIPAHDEAGRIEACLAALAMQRTSTGSPLPSAAFEVLVLANNCGDETAGIARTFAKCMSFGLHVIERRLPVELSHAGGARRVALDLAAERLARKPGRDGILMTTDADSRVGPSWVAANLAAIDAGVDAVAGYVDAEPAEYLALGRGFLDRGRLEDQYLALAAELYGRLDPRPHDPWPNHRVHSGASFALTLSAYRGIGGLPAQPLGEDVALAMALDEAGYLIRHSFEASVTTSCRFDSRARGGAGDTMKLRHAELDAPCDSDFEPASRLLRRARSRGRMRRLHAMDRLADGAALLGLLGLDARMTAALIREKAEQPFARLWARIEIASPRLERTDALRPSALPAEISRLERLLHRLSLEQTEHRTDAMTRDAPLSIEPAAASLR